MLALRPTSEPDEAGAYELGAYDEQAQLVATARVARDGAIAVFSGITPGPGAAVDELVDALRHYAEDAAAVSARVLVDQTELTAALAPYRIVSRNMYRPVGAPPGVPTPGAGHRPITGAEYEQWREQNIAGYAEDAYLARLGGDAAEALRRATASYDALLPEGLDTADTSLVVLTADGDRVGTLWLGHHVTRFAFMAERVTFIFGIDVDPDRQGEGWGKAGLAVSEQLCVAAGDPGVGLNVFADNTVANGLYRASGFRVVQQTFDLRQPEIR